MEYMQVDVYAPAQCQVTAEANVGQRTHLREFEGHISTKYVGNITPYWCHEIGTLCRITDPLCGESTDHRPVMPVTPMSRFCNIRRTATCVIGTQYAVQATGLDAWASRVKYPARFVSHLHEICIYVWVVYSLCFFCCLFITVTWWYVWCIEWASGNQEEVQACLVTLWLFIISC